jgi:hypothetical protein
MSSPSPSRFGGAEATTNLGNRVALDRRSTWLPHRFHNGIVIGCRSRGWDVEFHPDCEAWANGLEPADAEALLAAIRVLRDQGPNLGRPLVDKISGSRHKNMKELRPGSTGRTEVRVLFAFDRTRQAILLVGGDKSTDWAG